MSPYVTKVRAFEKIMAGGDGGDTPLQHGMIAGLAKDLTRDEQHLVAVVAATLNTELDALKYLLTSVDVITSMRMLRETPGPGAFPRDQAHPQAGGNSEYDELLGGI